MYIYVYFFCFCIFGICYVYSRFSHAVLFFVVNVRLLIASHDDLTLLKSSHVTPKCLLSRLGAGIRESASVIGNESVPKIIINDTINLLIKTAISISVISNGNSFRVLFDKIASVYYI